MLKLLIFILGCYGCTQILVFGSIFDRIRPKKIKFFHCPLCMGFYVGLLYGFAFYYFDYFSFINCFPIHLFISGCISSGTSYILCQLFGDNGIKIEKSINRINKE